jgi:hypothetical protein
VNIYLTKHRRLFADKPKPYRLWLLFLRWWYEWQASVYLRQSGICYTKRGEVLIQLSMDDEENENGVR